ncbi:TSUP family transporter [Bdellovibrio sp. HCB274]|uniref:TSUP family transporter n=1 Tax=Bdellovibrio sp. HCB274 TaxID=3394361 RepID=UPI0039B4A90C
MDLAVHSYIILFAVGLIAGVIDSIAGGGGLLTVPALLSAGLPPALALGTNKLQSTFGSFSASYYHFRRKTFDPRKIKALILFTFLGSALGTFLVQNIDSSFLNRVIPFMLIGFAVYFSLSPRLGDVDQHQRMPYMAFAISLGSVIGFYDGFFGPGTGSFWALAFVGLMGFNLSKATAHSKALNFVSNITSLAVFLAGGKIIWSVGLLMGAGQFIGGHIGSHLVIKKGTRLIKPLLIAISLIMSIKLFLN